MEYKPGVMFVKYIGLHVYFMCLMGKVNVYHNFQKTPIILKIDPYEQV